MSESTRVRRRLFTAAMSSAGQSNANIFCIGRATVADNIGKLEVPPCITIGYISRITISKISGWGPPAGVYAYKIIKEVRETV